MPINKKFFLAVGFTNPLPAGTTIESALVNLINVMLGLVGVLSIAALIYGSIFYIISLGNDSRVSTAKKTITWAIIGLVVSILSIMLVQFVGSVLGLESKGDLMQLLPVAHAQINLDPDGIDVTLPRGDNPQERVGELIVSIINLMLSFSAILAVGAIIWGGITMIVSGATNPSKAESAKKIIFWAIFGLLITGLSFLIVRFVGQALKVI